MLRPTKGLAAVAIALSGTLVLAQPRLPAGQRPPRPPASPSRPGPMPEEPPPATCPGPVRGQPDWRGRGPGPGTGLEPYFFRLSPEDRRPLAPGEAEELLEFARRELPKLYELFEHFRMRDPGRFPQVLAEHAPRLRHFRRIHELSPQLAAIVRDHADNAFRLHRLARRARHAPPDSPEREQAVQRMRALVAANLELEIRGAELLADLLEQHQEQRVAERTAALLSGEAPARDEPESLGKLLELYAAAGSEAEQADIRAQIQSVLADQAGRDVSALRRRAEQMRQTVTEECEHRISALLERGDRPPGPRGGRLGPPPGDPDRRLR